MLNRRSHGAETKPIGNSIPERLSAEAIRSEPNRISPKQSNPTSRNSIPEPLNRSLEVAADIIAEMILQDLGAYE